MQYLYAAGDSVSYDTVKRIDTSIAEGQLQKFVDNGNVPIPDNFVTGWFVQFAADHLDMQESTVDGKGSFHVTQMGAFQRGPPSPVSSTITKIEKSTALGKIPQDFHQLESMEVCRRPSPHFCITCGKTVVVKQEVQTLILPG